MNTDLAYEALAGLRDALPRLGDALMPGTRRRWNERDLTAEQRARRDVQAVADRAAKDWNARVGITAPGAGRAPLNLAVLDAITRVEAGIAELEAAICDRLGLSPLAGASPKNRITRIIGLLGRTATMCDLAEHVTDEAVRMSRQAARALGDVEQINKLKERCTICGALSLRAFPERGVVICVNDECRCGEDSCRCHADRPRRHQWPISFFAALCGGDLEAAS